jgi:sulfotransferase
MKKYYFISGLPRSGSTLLTAILNQNPNFYSDIASPLQDMLENNIEYMSGSDYSVNIDSRQREDVLKNIVEGYYKNKPNQVIFDSSRAWTGNTSLLKSLFPYTKIICCVRDINCILDSFEKIFNRNAYYKNFFFSKVAEASVITRCRSLMDVEKEGQVIKPLLWLKEGLSFNRDMIHLIEYNDLASNPEKTIKDVYNFIDQPYFSHNFDYVEYSNDLFDLHVNTPNLHKVKGKVEYRPESISLPGEVIQNYTGMEFWRN